MIRQSLTALAAILALALSAQAQELPAADAAAKARAPKDSAAVAAAPADSLAKAPADTVAKAPAAQPAQEFWKGWFGELNGMAGATAVFPKEQTLLKNNRGLLFNGSALVSAWSDQDQFTLVASGNNTNETTTSAETGETASGASEQGLTTALQTGVNYYTSRLKGIETSATANYKFTDTDTGTSSELNEFGEEEFMSTRATTSGKTYVHTVSANAELKKEKGNIWFHVKPLFRYTGKNATKNSDTRTMSGQIQIMEDDEEWKIWQEEQERWRQEEKDHMPEEEWHHWEEQERRTRYGWAWLENSSNGTSVDKTGAVTTEVNADLTLRELAGKKDRNLRFGLTAGIDSNGGTIDENSDIWTPAGDYEHREMHYDVSGGGTRLGGNVSYVEPIAGDITITATADASWTRSSSVRDASDAGGRNEMFSSVSNVNNVNQKYDVTTQYRFAPQSWVSFGGMLSGVLNETYSKSKGIEDTTGENDWYWFFTPTAKFQHSKGADRFSASISGNTQRPGTTQMLPVMDLRVPSRPGLGNIYLKPYSSSSLNASWARSNKGLGSNLSVSLGGSLNFNPIIYARWYDDKKVQYSLPVNSRKPGFTANLSASYTTPLDAEKVWTLAVSGSARYNSSVSYQARSALAGIDKKNFDYAKFMESFWGDASGNLFYDGTSGFDESITRMFQPSANAGVKFKQKHWNANAGVSTTGRISRYSLNPSINVNTLDTRLYASGAYSTDDGLEVRSSFAYVFYAGYTEGFGLPECQWNAEASKKFGDFVFSVKAFDILNQTRNLTHSVTANYEEDTYRITMGRYFLVGVKWAFGKADAARGQRARQAFKAMSL